jgi:hypothetical protein
LSGGLQISFERQRLAFAKSRGRMRTDKLTVQPRCSDHPDRRFFPVLRDKFQITARLEHRLCLRQFWIPIPQCPRDPRQDLIRLSYPGAVLNNAVICYLR